VISLSFMRGMRSPSEVAEAVDVDVTPVMNMFIIMIPFLVSMAVFSHLAIIDFSLPPNVGTQLDASGGEPKLKLTVVVAPGYLAVTFGEKMLDSLGLVDGRYDLDLLGERLRERRDDIELKGEAIVAVRDQIKFETVVDVMDKCREVGFEKIGLSSAAAEPPGGV
jgi:biopolymer transport protein ExbD